MNEQNQRKEEITCLPQRYPFNTARMPDKASKWS